MPMYAARETINKYTCVDQNKIGYSGVATGNTYRSVQKPNVHGQRMLVPA